MKFGIAEFIWFIILLLIVGVIILIFWKGKDLLKFRILQGSFFRQLQFVFSPPQSVQKNLALWETGDITMPLFPVSTGFETSEETKRQWAIIHSLKFMVFKDGKPYQDDSVLIISEKSYYPQDPSDRLKKKAAEKLASLNDIARTTHMVLRAEARKAKDHADIINTIIYGSFIIDGLSLLAYLIRIRTGGG